MKRRKILYIAPKFRYMNRTGEVFNSVLIENFDVFMFGPGYVQEKLLSMDVRTINDKFGPFDLVFIHQYFSMKNLNSAAKSGYFYFSVARFLRNHPRFPIGLEKIECPKFSVLLQLDPYALSEESLDYITSNDQYIITWDEGLVAAEDRQCALDDAAIRPTENFRKLHTEWKRKIIPFHHVVDESDFLKITWDDCKYDISIPGISYKRRKEAQINLISSSLTVSNLPLPLKIARIAYFGRINRYEFGLKMMWHYYKYQISNSRMSFAEGSGFNYPVRKFFEIPAYGTLLIAVPPNNSQDIGFISGENFIEADEKNFVDIAISLLKDSDKARRIMQNAQIMIREKHSSIARINQVSDCIERILSGTYYGARWLSGNLTFYEETET